MYQYRNGPGGLAREPPILSAVPEEVCDQPLESEEPGNDHNDDHPLAVAGQLALTTLGPRPGPDDPARPYRAAVRRIIAEALPPDWTAAHGLYVSRIAGPDGDARAYAYIGLDRHGRAVLAAGPVAASPPPPAPTTWDLADATTPDRF